MNLVVHPFTVGGLFKLGFKVYRTYFIPLIILNGILLVLPWTLPIAADVFTRLLGENAFSGFLKTAEVVLLFLAERFLEAAMLLGLAVLLFRPFIPVIGILQYFRSRVLLGVAHIALLQYFIFVFGVTGLFLPMPFNVFVVALWISSICFFSLAQPLYVLEGFRGMQALVRSAQIVRPWFARTFLIIMTLKLLATLIPGGFALLLLSDLDLPTITNSDQAVAQLAELFKNPEIQSVMRGAQYLTAFVFHPFAAIILCLFYLNALHYQAGFDFSKLSQLVANALGILPEEEVPQDSAEESARVLPAPSADDDSQPSETADADSQPSETADAEPVEETLQGASSFSEANMAQTPPDAASLNEKPETPGKPSAAKPEEGAS